MGFTEASLTMARWACGFVAFDGSLGYSPHYTIWSWFFGNQR
jgi:hypothetical protein